jgi:hypothetical protein
MTDATGYVAVPIAAPGAFRQYRFTIITRFENRSAAPVFLGRCYPDSPQPMYWIGPADGSTVEAAYNPNWACVGHNKQFEIRPGGARRHPAD